MAKAKRFGREDSFVVMTNQDPKFLGIGGTGVGINEAQGRDDEVL